MKTLKSLLIVVLILALGAAAAFTRPSEASFFDYLTGGKPRTGPTVNLPKAFTRTVSEHEADRLMRGTTFSDQIVFTTINRDGKTLYTGEFGHWFPHEAAVAFHSGSDIVTPQRVASRR